MEEIKSWVLTSFFSYVLWVEHRFGGGGYRSACQIWLMSLSYLVMVYPVTDRYALSI